MQKKSLIALMAALALLGGCGQPAASTPAETASSAAVSTADSTAASSVVEETSVQAEDSVITQITLEGDHVTIDGPGATAKDSVVTISQAGKYQFRGTLHDGQIIVDADKEDDVSLVLAGVDITCLSSAPIYIKKAQTAFIELEQENTVTDTANYVFAPEEDEPDAAIFSKTNLVLEGDGTLNVSGNYDMAIHGKDSVVVCGSGTYNLTAVYDGLKGKDSVSIYDNVTLNVDAGEDGIQGSNDKDEGAGVVTIEDGAVVSVNAGADGIKAEALLNVADGTISVTAQEDGLDATFSVQLDGGTFTIDAQEDGIQAGSDLTISGGDFSITTGGGSANAPEHREGPGFPGWFSTSTEEDASAKGLKAGTDLTISGGTFDIDSLDDAIHCAGTLTVSDGAGLTIATGDDGLHSDDTLNISGGKIDITKSYEGLEALFITISGGDIALVASDDGLNAAGGNEADFDFMGPPGFGNQAETLEDADYYVHITGGTLNVDAGGDGLDSNGALFVEGGTITVSGPENSMNGALDYTTTGQITGGTAIICGASGMAQNFDSSSTQPSLMYTFSTTLSAGTTVTLTDGSGNVLAEAVMAKSFNSVVISLPELTVGQTYTLTCGDQTAEIELTDTITTVGGFSGGGPGGGGPGGGGPGNMPGGFPPGG